MPILYNQLKDNFTKIPNELLTDNRLSMGAKVVYCYVASKPTGWEVWNAEIQKSLNIKDNGTMSKYWKELIETGWITRTRAKTDDGKFKGGYDYELQITPITENNGIRENPTYGKTPHYNNTNLYNNTNIYNNTNNIICSDEQIQEKENTSNTDTNKGQLFSTSNTVKKKGQNQFISVIEQLSSNNNVRDVLEEYYRFRCKKGLTIEQWKIIVEDFKNNSVGKNTEQIISAVRDCLKFGNMSLFYRNENNFSSSTPTKNTPIKSITATDSPISFKSLRTFLYLPEEQRKECVKYLTPEQKEEYFSIVNNH